MRSRIHARRSVVHLNCDEDMSPGYAEGVVNLTARLFSLELGNALGIQGVPQAVRCWQEVVLGGSSQLNENVWMISFEST